MLENFGFCVFGIAYITLFFKGKLTEYVYTNSIDKSKCKKHGMFQYPYSQPYWMYLQL